MKTVVMNQAGRLTIPSTARRQLGLEGEAEFEVEVDADQDVIILRPAIVLQRRDAWAYTPEHRSLLERAHRDGREGRVRTLSESQLKALGD